MSESVALRKENSMVVLTLNRPETYNSFDMEMVESLVEALMALALDKSVFGVVITGKGKAFCTGGDLRWIRECGKEPERAFNEIISRFHLAVLEIRRMPKPVLAAINGTAAGGGFSMALACDFRTMERSAVLRQGYTTNGLSFDGGGTFTLPRIVGLARAMEIAAFDQPIDAEKAFSWGLVTEVVEDGKSVEKAVEMIQDLKQGSLSSFAASKRLITDSYNNTFEAQLEKEREFLCWCGGHPNGREGVAAFLEKRKPVFNKSV
jgi:2-(1,2-epoxy-1,2-dihydrophenyl)acetyl-CoA isomerase